MRYVLIMLLALSCLHLGAEEAYPAADPELISTRIAELIDTGAPIFLQIQAGDLSTNLDGRVRQLLLARGADLREPDQTSGLDLNDDAAVANSLLGSLALQSARLVSVIMELGGTSVESKSFLSFRSERHPLYTFQIKQIQLPERRLERIDSLDFMGPADNHASPALSQARWLEPVIAATALASIIYLLWTIE